MSGITFLGAGSFGTALSIILSKKGHNINIWARNKDIVDDINVKRENIKYIKDVIIPSNVKAFTDLKSAIGDSDVIVIATPSHVVRNISRDIKPFIKENTIIVSLAKGMERKTFKRLSQVIKEENPNNPVVVLSKPSHAEEIALDIPTTVVVTSEDMEYAKKIQNIFMTNNFRVYTNEDIIGVEIGGAVKNIIALAAGVCDGAGYGDNTKAALMTRGISEIVKIGIALGAKQETFYGLSGMGDLIVTCTSFHSRNRKAGILIGKGYSVDEACKEVGMIVEGIKACEIFYSLKEKFCVSMPITDIIYNVLFKGENLKDGVYKLMSRDGKNEVY